MNVVFEFLFLIWKIIFAYMESIYRYLIPSRKSIVGQVVLITGGGRGIGEAIANAFAAHKTKIVIWDLNKDDAQAVADALSKRGVFSKAYVCDVSDLQQIKETAEQVKEDVGDVDILINNAGVGIVNTALKYSPDQIQKTFEVNTLAHFWMMDAFLPSMIERNHGHIVAMSSCAGLVGIPNFIPYSSSKFAVRGMMESLDMELRVRNNLTGIYTTTVCPMFVKTAMTDQFEFFDRLGKTFEPEEVASATLEAVLQNKKIITVPLFIQYFNFFIRLMPDRARMAVMNFAQAGIETPKED